jgi:hydroxylamine dehydrogenase
MIRLLSFLFLALLWPALAAADACVDCHRQRTPAAVLQWQSSAHAGAGVGCTACHGEDHERMLAGEAVVDAKVCGRCHQQAFAEHVKSRHGMGLHSGWGCTRNLRDRDPAECRFCHQQGTELPVTKTQCARFLSQSSEMGELGCNRCHQVQSNCATCHSNHLTDLKIARDPAICAKCHMGPDHPQWEMWQTSLHGVLYGSVGPEVGPSCQRCHMPGGSHDVSIGITASPSGIPLAVAKQAERREEMVGICVECHGARLVRQELTRADTIRTQSLALVKEAEQIVWDLHDRGLLDPMPAQRPPHPLSGRQLVTDGQLLYENTSHIERLLFKLKKYSYAKTIKGAYHQNPAYAHWYGNAEMKLDLVDIRAEASRLRQRQTGALPQQRGTAAEEIEAGLEILKKKFDRGALNAEDYAREKARLLDKL